MKQVKAMLYVAAALAIGAGSAIAQDTLEIEPEETASNASTVYDVDEDRDGRTDRLLILEQSDSLA